MKKLAIIVTHPIQYYVPVFQLLANVCDLKVFYTWGAEGSKEKYDPAFKKFIYWDLPLLEGYKYELVENTAKDAGSHHYNGIINPNLIKHVKTFNPDAILVYGWAYQSHLKVLRYFKGKVPVWFRGDSNLIDTQKATKQLLRSWFLKWVYRHVDKAFYVGKANKDYYKKFGIRARQLIFAPHAIDNERFVQDKTSDANELRALLNIKKEDILILYAGKFEKKKNPELLLDTFIKVSLSNKEQRVRNKELRARNKEQRPNLHLLFVGNGALERSLKLKVKSLKDSDVLLYAQDDNINKKIHFIDFQNQTQMPLIYQACDLFCLPSSGPAETWGLAVNEAMASGKAVLISDKVGCGTDLVMDEKNGYIFESGNESDLFTKLSKLCVDKDLLSNMGKVSLAKIAFWNFKNQVECFKTELGKI